MKRIIIALFFTAFATYANAASRFWVGGTGTWDTSTTTHWSASTGGAGGASVPGTSDTVTLDASSGAGTVTLAATITNIQSLTMTAFTGTVDMSVNNPSFTCTQLTSASAGGSPIIKLTSGTITVTGPNGIDLTGANASSVLNSGTIALTQTALSAGNNQPFTATGKTYGNLTIGTHTTADLSVTGGTFSSVLWLVPVVSFLIRPIRPQLRGR